MMNFDNKENPISGLGELLFKATRSIYMKMGEVILGALDKVDTEACDRINNQQDMLDSERDSD